MSPRRHPTPSPSPVLASYLQVSRRSPTKHLLSTCAFTAPFLASLLLWQLHCNEIRLYRSFSVVIWHNCVFPPLISTDSNGSFLKVFKGVLMNLVTCWHIFLQYQWERSNYKDPIDGWSMRPLKIVSMREWSLHWRILGLVKWLTKKQAWKLGLSLENEGCVYTSVPLSFHFHRTRLNKIHNLE